MSCIFGCLVTLVICSIVYIVCLLTQTHATTHKGARTDWKTSRRSWEGFLEDKYYRNGHFTAGRKQ